jgi:hypothetical protein
MIIGVCGFIGSGKDTIADYLTNFHGFRRESFASTLSAVGEAPGDVMTISHHPAASQPLVALPVKPIVLDLAFAGVPEPVETPAATANASGGGIFSSWKK